MNVSDQSEFRAVLVAVYALYGKDLSTPIIGMWWGALKPYDLAAVKDALNRHAVNPDTGQFVPKPADVVRMIDGGTADAALIAWAKLERAVQRVGTYQSVVFDDPIIHRCVSEMGGWIALGSKDTDEWPFERNRFVVLYRGYAGRRIAIEYPRQLAGHIEAKNRQFGYPPERPILIGDLVRAQLVLQGGSDMPALGFHRLPIAPIALIENKNQEAA